MPDVVIQLPAGTVIEDEGGQDKNQKTTIIVPPGGAANTYTSANPNLADDARFAKGQAGNPGVVISITVSGTSLKKIKTSKTI